MREEHVAAKAREVVQPAVEAAGYELVDVQWKHEQGGWVLRVFVDQPGGVGLADCERVSRELSALLDVHEVVSAAYSLEVSSPGLDRPLVTAAHFRRFLGKRARVRLRQGIEGRRNYAGTIVSVEGDGSAVTLEVDGREHRLPLVDLDRANLEIDLRELSKSKKGQGK
jgi:ribosome maturation factor RimP